MPHEFGHEIAVFCDSLNEWLAEHDEEEHAGEPCIAERANALAYIAHRVGCGLRGGETSVRILLLMLDRLQDYEAIHAEHREDE